MLFAFSKNYEVFPHMVVRPCSPFYSVWAFQLLWVLLGTGRCHPTSAIRMGVNQCLVLNPQGLLGIFPCAYWPFSYPPYRGA